MFSFLPAGRLSFVPSLPVCILEILSDVVRRFVGIVLVTITIRADNVARSVGGLDVSDDTDSDTLPRLFLVFSISRYVVFMPLEPRLIILQ